MTDTLSSFDENSKPVCHGSPRPLLELASIKMALNIWLQKYNQFYPPTGILRLLLQIIEIDFHYEGSNAVPQKIREMIDSRMYPIAKELDKWVKYLNHISGYIAYDEILSRLNLVSFGGNGTVHFKDTVANILEDNSLNITTRFEVACINCVEEKIDLFWPKVRKTLSVNNLQFDYNFMLYYWICRKEGKLCRIPLREFSCIERLMIDKCRQKGIHHLAIEYFLTFLSPDDRLVELDQLFNYEGDENFAHLFPNVDGPTQRQILDKYTTRILNVFVTDLKPVEYSVQCFRYIRDMITPESYCREVIVKSITFINDVKLYHGSKIPINEKNFWCKKIEIALEQIWLNTPAHLKEYTLKNLSTILKDYNKKYDFGRVRDFDRDIIFLLAVLSDADVELRNSVWIKYWPDWIKGVPPSQFEELMELCLMKPEAIEEFKSRVLRGKTTH